MRPLSPQEIESSIEELDSYLTPNELLFIRNHFGVPEVAPGQWRMRAGGMLERELAFGLADLRRFEVVRQPAVLQCAGNGRAFYQPPAAGAQWHRGAVGQAMWAGVRLRDVLERGGVKRGATHVEFACYDHPTAATAPPFVRSIPLARALDPTTLLGFEMNRAPLPPAHGGPVRLVVPGWTGNNWLKWIREITVIDHESHSHQMRTDYRLATSTEASTPVEANVVKSIIVRPLPDAILAPGVVTIAGFAYTGVGRVEQIEVSVDGNQWHRGELEPQRAPGAWQPWHFEWRVEKTGSYTLAARATDSNANVQPEAAPRNVGGYLWNGIDRVRCQVRG